MRLHKRRQTRNLVWVDWEGNRHVKTSSVYCSLCLQHKFQQIIFDSIEYVLKMADKHVYGWQNLKDVDNLNER